MRKRDATFCLCLMAALLAAPLSGGCEEDPLLTTDAGVNPDSGSATPDWNSLYASSTLQMCGDCHSPTAPGFTQGTEATQDWSSAGAALSSLRGNASGLEGNFAGCNGVPLIGATSSTSLLIAVLDPSVRATFSVPGFPECTADAIVDETLPSRVGSVPPALLQDLKDFIDEGGFN